MLCTQYIHRLKRTCKHHVEKGYRKCYQHRKTKYPRPAECPICLFTMARYFVPLNPCKHWVCPDCIVKSGKKECPLCRATIKVQSKHMILLRFYAEQMKKHVNDMNISLLPEDLQVGLRELVDDMLDEISLVECSEISETPELE